MSTTLTSKGQVEVILNLKHRMTAISVFHAAPPFASILSQLKLTG